MCHMDIWGAPEDSGVEVRAVPAAMKLLWIFVSHRLWGGSWMITNKVEKNKTKQTKNKVIVNILIIKQNIIFNSLHLYLDLEELSLRG